MDTSRDQLCFYRAILISKAHRELQEAKDLKRDQSLIKSLHKLYDALKKTRKLPKINRIQERAAQELREAVSGAAPATFDDVVKVAHHLRRNIVVLNLDMQMSKPRNVQFQTRSIKDYGWQTTLLVYLEVCARACVCVCVCVRVTPSRAQS